MTNHRLQADPSDRSAIVDRVLEYATALDSQDWALAAACFTEGAEFVLEKATDVGGPVETSRFGGRDGGRQAIVDHLRGGRTGLDFTQHQVTNVLISVDGDRASGTSYLQARHVLAGSCFSVAGTYRDRFRRAENGWLIEHRTLRMSWVEGDSAIFLRGLERAIARGGEDGLLARRYLDTYAFRPR